MFMWTLISCVIHIIFRNGVNVELAKEEFVSLKLLIARMFKDKTYLSLWELMLNREPYCSEYKVSFCSCSSLLYVVWVLLSSTNCLNKSLECIFLSEHPTPCAHYAGPPSLSCSMWKCENVKSDTRASLHPETVEDLIRISVEGPSLEDFDARESVASWFTQGQRSRRPNYRSWPSEGHVIAMEDRP